MTTGSNELYSSVDCDLKAAVQDELDWDPIVPSTSIGISVTDHTVTLAGIVHTLAHRQAAVTAARRVRGVHALVDSIVVVPADAHGSSDQEIALAVERVLENASAVPAGIQATVRQGVVTLTGLVEFHYQKHAAGCAVRNIHGVPWAQNNIVIQPHIVVAPALSAPEAGIVNDDVSAG